MSDFERLGSMLGRVVPGRRHRKEAQVAAVWATCVGPEIAQNARPVSVRRGSLVVATSSSAWAHALQLMESDILSRLNAALVGAQEGDDYADIRRLVVRAAGWERVAGAAALGAAADGKGFCAGGEAAPVPPPRRRAPLPAHLEDEVRRVQSVACDEELGQAVAGAMRAWLDRKLPRTVSAEEGEN
ncbi:MAG: DUF721 domain-containing protein [Actinobacteria bacterium]|nr:DUF721 domain-containing protein [Actinomycetota bacterium]